MPQGQSRSLIAFDRAACVRGGRLLFRGVSFALQAREALLLTGPNGVGKSSLLRLAGGLLAPYSGTVERHAIAALADENLALDRDRRLGDALAFWADIDGAGRGKVDEALATLEISHLADVPVRMLSTGQKKRATLARTMSSGAAIWLLDEPTNGLDKAAVARLEQAIANHRAAGGAVIAASHTDLHLPDCAALHLTPPTPDELEALAA